MFTNGYDDSNLFPLPRENNQIYFDSERDLPLILAGWEFFSFTNAYDITNHDNASKCVS